MSKILSPVRTLRSRNPKDIVLDLAARSYEDRQARATHPGGRFDAAGRWWPTEQEYQPCCMAIRNPSRQHPYNLNAHCRSLVHVAHRRDLDVVPSQEASEVSRPPRTHPHQTDADGLAAHLAAGRRQGEEAQAHSGYCAGAQEFLACESRHDPVRTGVEV